MSQIVNKFITNATINLTSKVTGVLPIANGGSGAATTSQNFALLGPTSGSGAPSFRALVAGDLPSQFNAPLGINVSATAGTTLKLQASTDVAAGNLQLLSAANGHAANFYIANNGFFYINVADNTNFALVQSNAGNVGIGGTGSPDTSASVTVSQATNQVQLAVRGNATQTTNLQIWENSSNTVLAAVSQTGAITGSNLSGTNTGDQTITLTGDVTGSGTGSFAATIANLAVTNAKIANATIDLTTKVTGVLPVANGGTGQSSYTDGQLLIGNSTGNTLNKTTLTAGSNITITNGSGSITIAASSSANPAFNFTSQSSNYPAVIGDYVYATTTLVVTLPTAVSQSGKVIAIEFAGTSLNDVVTINTTGGQTVGGIASGVYKLNTVKEVLEVISDGSNWQINSHITDTGWVTGATTGTITGTTTNPTKGTVVTDQIYWKRVGDSAHIRINYYQSGTGSAGSGDYVVPLPSSMVINTTLAPTQTTPTGNQINTASLGAVRIPATGTLSVNASNNGNVANIVPFSTTSIRIETQGGLNGYWGSATGQLSTVMSITAEFILPISTWQP